MQLDGTGNVSYTGNIIMSKPLFLPSGYTEPIEGQLGYVKASSYNTSVLIADSSLPANATRDNSTTIKAFDIPFQYYHATNIQLKPGVWIIYARAVATPKRSDIPGCIAFLAISTDLTVQDLCQTSTYITNVTGNAALAINETVRVGDTTTYYANMSCNVTGGISCDINTVMLTATRIA